MPGHAADLAEDLKGPCQIEVLSRQAVEGDNLRAAWRLTVETGDLDELYQGLRTIHGIYEFGLRHGEGMSLGNLGDVAMRRGDAGQARQYFQQSIQALYQTTDWGISVSYKKLGHLDLLTGHFAEAEENLKRAVAISRNIQRAGDIQEVLTLQALLSSKTGQVLQARAILAQVLARARPPSRRCEPRPRNYWPVCKKLLFSKNCGA